MDLFSGLQTLLGGTPASRAKGEGGSRPETDLARKNTQLKEQLEAARERIAQLESHIEKMKKENDKVEHSANTTRENIDQLITGTTIQIQEMIDALDQQMKQLEVRTQRQLSEITGTAEDVKNISMAVRPIAEIDESVKQIDEIKAMIEELKNQKTDLEAINERSESIRDEILEKIHTEDVACYRNMKSLVTEWKENVDDVEISENSLHQIRTSFKGMKFLVIASFVILLFLLLYTIGYIVI
ncbi:MAG: hypothetical protein LUC41_00365 [Clostridiales bacterium]|nr:hypothetical protein [Clostridiales bacterium]